MTKAFLTILAILSLVLVACGDDAGTTASAGGSTEQVEESGSGLPTREIKEMKPGEASLVGSEPKPEIPNGPPPDSLVVEDLIEGDGPVAQEGDVVTIQYVAADYKTGTNYDSSWEWTNPYVFTMGNEEVMAGLEQGIEGMAVGDRRQLVIPPALANPDGTVGGIPEKETVVYVVDLLAVE